MASRAAPSLEMYRARRSISSRCARSRGTSTWIFGSSSVMSRSTAAAAGLLCWSHFPAPADPAAMLAAAAWAAARPEGTSFGVTPGVTPEGAPGVTPGGAPTKPAGAIADPAASAGPAAPGKAPGTAAGKGPGVPGLGAPPAPAPAPAAPAAAACAAAREAASLAALMAVLSLSCTSSGKPGGSASSRTLRNPPAWPSMDGLLLSRLMALPHPMEIW
mmetsp:Transcript_39437/g.88195  ORF Transcript_39437/g.88195 Transcript_39437/m.88195 type:complete len:217 (-) Transcript_39437:252-902(-)